MANPNSVIASLNRVALGCIGVSISVGSKNVAVGTVLKDDSLPAAGSIIYNLVAGNLIASGS